jgi:hypothetical protein
MTITVPVPEDVQTEVSDLLEDDPDANVGDLLADRFTWTWNSEA